MAKKKTGRKILGSSVAHPLTVRIDDVLRERLQQEADKRAERKHGWNLSQEILMRLNQSLDGDEEDKRKRGPLWAISYLMGQIETNGLLSILLTDQFERRILPVEQRPPWHRNADVFEAFTVALNLVLKGIKPKGGTLPRYLTNAGITPQQIGEDIAEGVLFQIRHEKPMTPEQKEEARREYLYFHRDHRDPPDDLEIERWIKDLQDGYYDEERARRYLGIEWTEAPPKREDGENG